MCPFSVSGLGISPVGQCMYGILGPTSVHQVLDVESYSLHRCLPMLLWLPGWCSRRGTLLLTLWMPVFKNTTYSAFFSLDERQENKQNPKNCSEAKTKVPGFICRNLLDFSILLVSRFTSCFPLYSLFSSTVFTPFLNQISDIFPSLLNSCMQATFFLCLVTVFHATYHPFVLLFSASYHHLFSILYFLLFLFSYIYFWLNIWTIT